MQDQNTVSYAAGWYPDTANPGTQRYYDGAAWTQHTSPITATPPADAPKKKRKWPWVLIAAAVVFLVIVITVINGAKEPAASVANKPAAVAEEVEPEGVEEVAPVMVAVPAVVGMTATDATNALLRVGLKPATYSGEPDQKVIGFSPAGATELEMGSEVVLVLEQKPVYTLSQKNAIGSAKSYLDYSGFSRSGLIGQLEYEGFSTEDATFGADNAGADWNAECAQSAQSYLDYSAFSRDGLYDQLAYEGFEPAQIEAGLAAVGY